MKSLFLNLLALTIITSGLTSCDGCSRKSSTTTSESSVDADDAASNGTSQTGTTGASTSQELGVPGDGTTTSGTSNTSNVVRNEYGTTTKKTKSGYSAPDGTDAENHDGDPYTKHDTTAMPTGTSIR